MENVPLVVSQRNVKDFNDWCLFLEEKGYSNFHKVLNATEIGYPEPIPQNRNRCFMISILGDKFYEFPTPKPLRFKLKDLLEEEVDEKYYLSKKMIDYIVSKDGSYKVNNGNLVINRDIACTKTTREGSTRADCSDYVVQGLKEENINLTKPSFQEVYDKIKNSSFSQEQSRIQESDVCDTLLARDYKDPKCIVVKNATKQGYLLAEEGDGIDISGRMETHRGTVQKGLAQTLKTTCDVGVCVPKVIGGIGEKKSNNGTQYYQQDRIYDGNVGITISTTAQPYYQTNSLSIRKLTPKECWRLMGFEDEDYERASKVNSNAQLYKQAGNSIVVNCLAAIFKEMF